MPGIGGVLDLIDSLCFAAPVTYFYLLRDRSHFNEEASFDFRFHWVNWDKRAHRGAANSRSNVEIVGLAAGTRALTI